MDKDLLSELARQLHLPPNDSRTMPSGALSALGRVPPRRSPPQFHPGMTKEQTAQYIRDYKDWFEEDRKIPPESAPLVDPLSLIAEQSHRRAELERSTGRHSGSSGVPIFTTIVGFPKHSSTTSVESLQPVTFAGMLVRRAHVGQYLLCRIVAPCCRMVAVQTIVEDIDGRVHDLSIYNFPSTFDCDLKHVDTLFPLGAVLAIREPTFKAPLQGIRPIIRVDSPTDIVFVVPDSPILHNVAWQTGATVPRSPAEPATLDAWRQRGNAYFNSAQWFLAAWAYSRGLVVDPDATVVRSNRAEVYLRLNYFSGAAADAQQVLATDGIPDGLSDKTTFRLAKAEYGRGEYDAAVGHFTRWQECHLKDAVAAPWIQRCQARQAEKQTGQYNWVSMFREAEKEIRLDVADFVGPMEVSQMMGRGGGRGAVATKEIKTGELLLVTKPFASAYASDLPQDKIIITLDLISNISRERTDAVLMAHIIDKLYGNPDLRDQVYHLYAGPDYPSPPSSYPPPLDQATPVDLFSPRTNIDIAQLEAICIYNNFCPLRLEDNQVTENAKPTGLYPLASLFNHSCGANSIWYCIGDVMIVRAAEPIPSGAEITIPYTVEESYVTRQGILKKHMQDHCTCWLCEEDRKDGDERLRRRHALNEMVSSHKLTSASLKEVQKFEKDVRETFAPTRGPVRPLSALALHVLAEKLRASGNPRLLRESLEEGMNALQCLGFEVAEGALGQNELPIGTDRIPTVTSFLEPCGMMFRIACTYLNLREQANAVPWLKASLWLTNASVGGGKDLFMLVHRTSLEQMGIRDLAVQVL
ncbi:transcription factor [Ganoderma sinense ZZ0214-1]|uniref:Transcription factor n=1 Tax=Ganoderma sinense ZZ0214-1 TaxID=1077348 RepID=A0A2G8SUC6_9APHY|nr:transcription factor [Ganoderma sinense ZZ0214-1]